MEWLSDNDDDDEQSEEKKDGDDDDDDAKAPTAAQLQSFVRTLFMMFDSDADGKVSVQELKQQVRLMAEAAARADHPTSSAAHIKALTAQAMQSYGDLDAFVSQHFGADDANKDGVLDRREFTAAFTKHLTTTATTTATSGGGGSMCWRQMRRMVGWKLK
jgi:Ca2+-binding EF-hand superfamily protein